jgi:hypothetical protein
VKLNPSKDPPPRMFTETLRIPIKREALSLNNHYKCMEIGNMSGLREVLEFNSTVEFL